ncbi:AE7-like protein, partial [Tanacetum coccineum]
WPPDLVKVIGGGSSGDAYDRYIKDPEHPYSLKDLKVITEDAIEVDDKRSYVRMATIIGLCLRVKLMRSLPNRFKVDIRVAPGTHATEDAGGEQTMATRLEFVFSPLSLDIVLGMLATGAEGKSIRVSWT